MTPPTARLIEPLGTLSHRVGLVLDRYATAQNMVFGFSLRQFLPVSSFFTASEFKKTAEELSLLSQELQDIIAETEAVREMLPTADVPDQFLTMLEEYLPILAHSVSLLRDLCIRLAMKTTRELTYSWSDYRKDVRVYNVSVTTYRKLGKDLNRAMVAAGI